MRWFFIIWALIGLTTICGGAPTGSETPMENLQSETMSTDASISSSSSSSPLSSARRLSSHDVGLPSELAWQAWLVIANQPDAQSSFESATVPRRISPKSVFVAPELQPRCPDGYRSDSMGRCVKETIQINYKTHLEFILERLRAKYPSPVQLDDSAATGTESKDSAVSGPLQVNISLGIEDNLSASRIPLSSGMSEREEDESADDSMEISVVRVPQNEALKSDKKPPSRNEEELTSYQVGNGTVVEKENEKTFFRGNISEPFRDHTIREVVVPVAEFVDDGNQTFTEVIDYKIPISLGQLLNTSNTRPMILPEENITEVKNVDDAQRPTVVLLLSPNKLTGTTSTSQLKDADSSSEIPTNDHRLVGTENLTANSTGEEEVQVDTTELNSTFETTTVGEAEEVTLADDGVEETTLSESPDILATTNYPEEDSEETTESNDEILTHGEAGMLISAGKFSPAIHTVESNRSSLTANVSTSRKTADENSGGNISSESSISGDIILETTLLDLNTGTTRTRGKLDDLRELFEAEEDVDLEPEVIFSPQDARRLDRLSTRGKKRVEDHAISPVVAVKQSSLVSVDDFSTVDSTPEETVPHTSRHKDENESYEAPSPSELSNWQQRRRTTYRNQDHVRFPDDSRQPSSSYVLFPSADHSNSINGNLNYKERSSLANTESLRPQSIPKSNVPLHQKKTYWHLPTGWRIDDVQPPRQQVPSVQNNANQRQNPILFRFWTRMPLIRDPSLTMSNQSSRTSPMVNPIFSQTVRAG